MNVIFHQKGRDALYKTWNFNKKNMILYVTNGNGSVVFQDKIYPMKSGGIYFIKHDKIHYTMPEAPENYDRSKLFFDNELLQGILKLLPSNCEFRDLFSNNSSIYAQIPAEHRQDAEEYFLKLTDSKETEETALLALLGLLRLLRKYKTESMTAPSGPLEKALEYINAEYSREITLDGICKIAHTSKYNFCRKFKKALGVTVMEYLLKTRIAAAQNLLLDSSLSLGEVSERCGFSSQSYFCQAFKQNLGTTPKEYRRKRLSSMDSTASKPSK